MSSTSFDSIAVSIHEHTLPYVTLMEEIAVRRPGAISTLDFEQEFSSLIGAQAELDRKKRDFIQTSSELSAATRLAIDKQNELLRSHQTPVPAERPTDDRRILRGKSSFEAAVKSRDHKAKEYEKALADYQLAVQKVVETEQPLKARLHAQQLTALCLSGGGIRSASFGLGVLIQLARYSRSDGGVTQKKGLLKQLDYVSTVSGGGYIGSWFTGWIKRHPRGLDGVIDEIAGPPISSADPEPGPVRHLRDYTSYLAPRIGYLSADSWVLAGTVLRNLFLNWAILIPALAACLLLPALESDAMTWFTVHGFNSPLPLYATMLFALLALTNISQNLPVNYKVQPAAANFLPTGIAIFAAAWFLTVSYVTSMARVTFVKLSFTAGAAYGGMMIVRTIAASSGKGHQRYTHFLRYLLLQGLAFSASTAAFLWILLTYVGPFLISADPEGLRLYISFFLPLVLVSVFIAMLLFSALSGPFETEVEDREWWVRAGSLAMAGTTLWTAAHLLVLYSADLLNACRALFGFAFGTIAFPLAMVFVVVIVGALARLTALAPATPADTLQVGSVYKLISRLKVLIPLLGGVFFALLASTLAMVNAFVVGRLSTFGDLHRHILITAQWLGLLMAVTLLANVLFDANTISLHSMYRSRLIRAYLGASNDTRKPNPFINFDPDDDFPMCEAPCSNNAPLHVINMALNLVATKKLAWQQRKAESFTVTPLRCGSFRIGYQPTRGYANRREGITIGTAMAISGAAANPNMGYHSSPMLTLAMTFFNARLGWWLPNPGPIGRNVWSKAAPVFSLGPLINEAFGRTTDDRRWIHASDGGHFENLGLYEMVLRRCKQIIVVDGSADREFKMNDLGNAIRKIHIDLGVPIEFNPVISLTPGPKPSNRHCFVGVIKYSCVDGEGTDGRIVYIKASLNGSEPEDVVEYWKNHPEFPHEPTSNQFFNETQFQSYVRLGSHIVSKIVAEKYGSTSPADLSLGEFFEAASKQVGTSPESLDEPQFSRSATTRTA